MNITITQKPFSISGVLQNEFSQEEIEDRLYILNQSCSGQYYMVDYNREKIFVPSPYALILCGYEKEIAEREGLDFYTRIFKKTDCEWIDKMNKASYQLLYNYSIFQRKRIVIFYDFVATMANGNEVILRHKVMPYKLCENGNVWLGLCHVTLSTAKNLNKKAVFMNTATNEIYLFTNDEFVLLNKPIIATEEIQILECLVKGLVDKEIADLMNISIDRVKWKKRRLFKKLHVKTSICAIHQAHLLGLI